MRPGVQAMIGHSAQFINEPEADKSNLEWNRVNTLLESLNIASTLQDLSALVLYFLLGCSLAGQHQQQVPSCRNSLHFASSRIISNLPIPSTCCGAQVGHGCYRLSSIPRYGFELGAMVGGLCHGISWVSNGDLAAWLADWLTAEAWWTLEPWRLKTPGSAPQPCVRQRHVLLTSPETC